MTTPSPTPFLDGPPRPLIVTLRGTSLSPFEQYARIASDAEPSFLFESGKGPLSTGRYSFFADAPYQTLSGKNRDWAIRTADGKTRTGQKPFHKLAEMMQQSPIARPPGIPPFFGGAVGYLSYDLARQFESLPIHALDDLHFPDLEFAFFDLVAACDHDSNELHLIFCPPLERFSGESRESLYREGCARLAALQDQLARPSRQSHDGGLSGPITFGPQQSQASYMDRVRRCQDYIAAGDLYQANLSHRFSVTSPRFAPESALAPELRAYARLRAMNPSPFSGLLRFGGTSFISTSPERLVRLTGRQADTRPIAGTRPRGRDAADDRRLIEELLASEKERAEHLMLVDLERNDLGRLCDFGSVRVDELMTIEQYSHVSHLVSHISGRLRADTSGFDLLRAVFPGGTITGVPKIRCMEVIEELEPVRRGPYTGSMGYFSWSGDLDFNIVIRTLVLREGQGYLQVGAGIVADSDPAREYEETIHKAQAFLSALS
ncbi:MAG TPA: anthranilate synthase component I family protein [Nitrospira sp.]|nr:anthranilate synthase component I family protein [Nitrospira sp.]